MTIKEFTSYLKKYNLKYRFDIGEDKEKVPFSYFLSLLKRIFFERKIKYSKTQGEDKLIKAIKDKETINYQYLDNANILISNGSTEAIFMASFFLKSQINKALIFTPTYPLYMQLCSYLKIPFEEFNLEKYNFNLTYDIFLPTISEEINLIYLNTPNNPTGRSYNQNELKKIINYCKEKKIFLIIDQVYNDFDYINEKIKLPILENVIYVKSFSKSYNLTGLRLGYLIANSQIILKLIELKNHLNITSSILNQDVAIDSLKRKNHLYKKYLKNKNLIEQKFKTINQDFIFMEGGFYCFINIKKYRMSDYDLSLDIAKNKHISLLPGSLFCQPNYLRLSYACSYNYLKKGLNILIKYFNEIENKLITQARN